MNIISLNLKSTAKMPWLVLLLLLYLPAAYAQTISRQKYLLALFPYQIQDSKKAAVYSSLAYCDNNCMVDWSCQSAQKYSELQNVTAFENVKHQIKAYIGYLPSEKRIVIAFRGSEKNTANWMTNLNARKEKYRYCLNCQIHWGFYKAFQSVAETLYEIFQQHITANPTAKTLVTGHSLGGALALIAGIQLRQKYGVSVQIHTFGAPRVGNAAFASYVSQNIENLYRVVHNRDIVAHLPPLSSGFKHPAYEIFWNQDFKKYKACGADGEDKSCSNQYKHFTIDDHYLYFIRISHPSC